MATLSNHSPCVSAAPARAIDDRGFTRQDALGCFADLDSADVKWILSSGVEQQVIASTIVVREGEVPSALYLVLEGLVEVRVQAIGAEARARLGPGAIVGEMSFLEDSPASATVRAVENTLLLSLDCATLGAKLQADPAFATRLYRPSAGACRAASARPTARSAARSPRGARSITRSRAGGSRSPGRSES